MLTNLPSKEANKGNMNITVGLVVISKLVQMEEKKRDGIIRRKRKEVAGKNFSEFNFHMVSKKRRVLVCSC